MLTCRLAAFICFLHGHALLAQDLNILPAIKEEAFSHSQAAEDVFYLADVFGPRFMDSPGYVKAGDWAVERLKAYGLTNVAKEYFATPGPGWGFTGVSLEMLAPSYSRLEAFPPGGFPACQKQRNNRRCLWRAGFGCDNHRAGVSTICCAVSRQVEGQDRVNG